MTLPGPVSRSTAIEGLLAVRRERLDALATETVPLDAIGRRTLAAPIVAEHDQPAADRATMDGYAIDARESFPLTLRAGLVGPEDDPPSLDAGETIEIATGAPLPERANAVLKREDATRSEDTVSGPSLDPGTNVLARGSNVTAGEEVFPAGHRLRASDAPLLRDLDRTSASVRRPFSVGVLATGTEIHAGVQPDRDSAMLVGLVEGWGHVGTHAGSVPDDADTIGAAIDELAREHDVVLTSGGTSVGRADHVIGQLADRGEVLFNGVRIRPGRPVTVARLSDPAAIAIAFPGKPVAATLAALVLARAFFTGSASYPTETGTLAVEFDVPGDEAESLVPVVAREDGLLPMGHLDSPLAIDAERFRPGRIAASPRALAADGVWPTTTGGAAGDPIEYVPLAVLQ